MRFTSILLVLFTFQNILLAQDIELSKDSTSIALQVYDLEQESYLSDYKLKITGETDTLEITVKHGQTQYLKLKSDQSYTVEISKSGYLVNSIEINYIPEVEALLIEAFMAGKDITKRAKKKARKFIVSLPEPFCEDASCGGFEKITPAKGNIWLCRISYQYNGGHVRTYTKAN